MIEESDIRKLLHSCNANTRMRKIDGGGERGREKVKERERERERESE